MRLLQFRSPPRIRVYQKLTLSKMIELGQVSHIMEDIRIKPILISNKISEPI
jgi:hypothetical protein